jgi:hypothetical protein
MDDFRRADEKRTTGDGRVPNEALRQDGRKGGTNKRLDVGREQIVARDATFERVSRQIHEMP